jgi:hypothetical protein
MSIVEALNTSTTKVSFQKLVPQDLTHLYFACPEGFTCATKGLQGAVLEDVKVTPFASGPSLYDITIVPQSQAPSIVFERQRNR